MAAVNYYIGFSRGQSANEGNASVGTSTAGTSVDVEVRLQINNGSVATGLTKEDAVLLMEAIRRYILSNGIQIPPAGTDLPAL